MFARLRLQRLSSFSSRFVTVERTVLHRSPIALTPYRADGTIDAGELERFVARAYTDAGIAPETIDTGAVILTGTALERRNAAEIGELFARQGGRFVCVTAGHKLEAILSAHGSGAVARSRREGATVLNVDVGGGTAKLALVDRGEVVATTTIAAGARLVAFDREGRLERLERAARPFARRAGVTLRPGTTLSAEERSALAEVMAQAIATAARSRPLPAELAELQLLDQLPSSPEPAVVTVSGGVGELLAHPSSQDHGDLGHELAAALRTADLRAPVAEPDDAIRATVVGASQFSVQLSGNTIYVSDERLLPLHNVPVVPVQIPSEDPTPADVEVAVRAAVARAGHGDRPLAIALPFRGEPRYARLRAIAEGLDAAVGGRRPLVAELAGDVALSIGRILAKELGRDGGIVVLDDLELADLDYIDIGAILRPANVVPVVVKSLVFPEDPPPRQRPPSPRRARRA